MVYYTASITEVCLLIGIKFKQVPIMLFDVCQAKFLIFNILILHVIEMYFKNIHRFIKNIAADLSFSAGPDAE